MTDWERLRTRMAIATMMLVITAMLCGMLGATVGAHWLAIASVVLMTLAGATGLAVLALLALLFERDR